MQKSKQIQQKIEEKRVELASLSEIKRCTEDLNGQLGKLEEQLNNMCEGTESVALVLSNWQNVVRSISLASLGLYKYGEKDYEDKKPMPESLVRIKLDKDELEEERDASEEEGEDSEGGR